MARPSTHWSSKVPGAFDYSATHGSSWTPARPSTHWLDQNIFAEQQKTLLKQNNRRLHNSTGIATGQHKPRTPRQRILQHHLLSSRFVSWFMTMILDINLVPSTVKVLLPSIEVSPSTIKVPPPLRVDRVLARGSASAMWAVLARPAQFCAWAVAGWAHTVRVSRAPRF
jgi:hypothetical protein